MVGKNSGGGSVQWYVTFNTCQSFLKSRRARDKEGGRPPFSDDVDGGRTQGVSASSRTAEPATMQEATQRLTREIMRCRKS